MKIEHIILFVLVLIELSIVSLMHSVDILHDDIIKQWCDISKGVSN